MLAEWRKLLRLSGAASRSNANLSRICLTSGEHQSLEKLHSGIVSDYE